MAIFGQGDKRREGDGKAGPPPQSKARPTAPHEAFCRVCNRRQKFSRCWLRVDRLAECPCCKTAFPNPAALYQEFQPVCPRCGEYLEQPGFEYGLCDGCGSKYELVAGTRPDLLPNLKQRAEMEKHGKTWKRT